MSPSFDISSYLKMLLDPAYTEEVSCVGSSKDTGGRVIYFNMSEENKKKFIKEISMRTNHPESVISSTFANHPSSLFRRAIQDIYKVEYSSVEECLVDVFGSVEKFLIACGFKRKVDPPNKVDVNPVKRMSLMEPREVDTKVEDIPVVEEEHDLQPVPAPSRIEEISTETMKKSGGSSSRLSKIMEARRGKVAPVEVKEPTVEPNRIYEEPVEIVKKEVPIVEEEHQVIKEVVPEVEPKREEEEEVVIPPSTVHETQSTSKMNADDFSKQLQISVNAANETGKFVRQLEEMFLSCASPEQIQEYKKSWFLKDEDDLEQFVNQLLPNLDTNLLVKALGKTLRRRWRDGDSKGVSKFVEILMDFLD